ncbi:MAG: hypothetical protein VX704_03730 [Verrucomicrobiota bacterium]|nr:hypothetical protein [Verrucomicrobiota bacterium]
MKKILTVFTSVVMAYSAQAQQSLGEQINENGVEWILGTWEAEVDGNTMTLSYKWALKEHVIAQHFKGMNLEGNSVESFSLIAINPTTGEIEQTGYDTRGKKSIGNWGPRGDMPLLRTTSTSQNGEKQSMAVGFRRIDENNIELQIFRVDSSGSVSDFSEMDIEMKRKK